MVNDHIQRAKYIARRHYRVCCCCFVGHIHCEELDLISISFRQIGQRLNVPSCRQHSIASSEARFNNCVTPTTRAAGDYPYLRHSSSSIKPPGYSGESSQTQDWMRDGYTKGLVSYGGNRRIFRPQGDPLSSRVSDCLATPLALTSSWKSKDAARRIVKDKGSGLIKPIETHRKELISAK